MTIIPKFAVVVFVLCFLQAVHATVAEEPRFEVVTKRADDKTEVTTKDGKTTFLIRSPFGIGNAVVSLANGLWPEHVILRLYLKGLEDVRISDGKVELVTAAPSNNGRQKLRDAKSSDEGESIDKTSPYWMAIRMIGSDGKPSNSTPLEGGYFEILLPNALLKDNPKSITISWIDFYR